MPTKERKEKKNRVFHKIIYINKNQDALTAKKWEINQGFLISRFQV